GGHATGADQSHAAFQTRRSWCLPRTMRHVVEQPSFDFHGNRRLVEMVALDKLSVPKNCSRAVRPVFRGRMPDCPSEAAQRPLPSYTSLDRTCSSTTRADCASVVIGGTGNPSAHRRQRCNKVYPVVEIIRFPLLTDNLAALRRCPRTPRPRASTAKLVELRS